MIEIADKFPSYAVGEYGQNAVLEPIMLSGTLVAADAGKPLKVTGFDQASGMMKAALQTTDTRASYIAIKGQTGSSGDIVTAVCSGLIKCAAVDGAITAGQHITAKAGKISAYTQSGNDTYTENPSGHARSTFADGDTGLIFFDGV